MGDKIILFCVDPDLYTEYGSGSTKLPNTDPIPRIPVPYLVAVGVDALALPGPLVHPLLAALQIEVAAQAPPPLELLSHGVVGQVPARVLHQRHRDARVDGVLGVRTRHCLVLKQPLLPVGQRCPLLSL